MRTMCGWANVPRGTLMKHDPYYAALPNATTEITLLPYPKGRAKDISFEIEKFLPISKLLID